MKKTFTFNYDQKCTVWCRTNFEVEAETQEEANLIAQQKIISGEIDEPWDPIYETMETMSIKDNDNNSTEELLTWPQDIKIWDNKTPDEN